MLGLMQDYPLLAHTILDHAAINHGERELVTRSVEGPIRRTTLADVHNRSLKVAKALEKEGVTLGDRIATLAWNTERHMEAWFGIMGLGAICHTLNPRLFAEQLDYIVNHAEDEIVSLRQGSISNPIEFLAAAMAASTRPRNTALRSRTRSSRAW